MIVSCHFSDHSNYYDGSRTVEVHFKFYISSVNKQLIIGTKDDYRSILMNLISKFDSYILHVIVLCVGYAATNSMKYCNFPGFRLVFSKYT